MKIMNVSFSIDVKNIEHVNALTKFMAVLGEHPQSGGNTPVEVPPRKKKDVPPVSTESKDAPVESPDQPEQAKEETAISLEILRGKVSSLVKQKDTYRTCIKAKLAEFDVASVSTLSKDYYTAFYQYLNTLENENN